MSGWHFHPRLYPTQAWRDDTCPDPQTAVPLDETDERVSRVQAIEAAEDRAEQAAFDSWRERGQ